MGCVQSCQQAATWAQSNYAHKGIRHATRFKSISKPRSKLRALGFNNVTAIHCTRRLRAAFVAMQALAPWRSKSLQVVQKGHSI